MKKIPSENINGIKQSLLASLIFVILLEPIIIIGKNMGKGIVYALIDYFYYSCSRTNWGSVVGYCAFIAVVFYIIKSIGDSVPGAFPSKSENAEGKATQHYVEESKESTSEESIMNIINAAEKLQQHEKKLERLDKIYKWLLRVNIIIQTLFFCYILIYQFAAAEMNESFDRHITQIAPYTDSQNIEMIKSHWVQMETKSDYEEIVQEINEIRNENNLK